MAQVVLPNDLSRRFADGVTELEVEASNIRQLIRALETRFPGLGTELEATGMAVAIDGVIFQDTYLAPIEPESEIYFLPPIGGG